MWEDRVIDVWDDRFVFVLSALFGISICIVIAKRREALRTNRIPWLAYSLLFVTLIAAALILRGRLLYYAPYATGSTTYTIDRRYPGLGTALVFLIGCAVGSFSARYVWSLFGQRFGAKDPLVGALVLLILVIVYSLPIYRREVAEIFAHVGLSSVKTPIAEFTFAERSQFQRSETPAAKLAGQDYTSGIPRPSYPLPGLERLKNTVSGTGENEDDNYMDKDAKYIASFEGAEFAKAIRPTRTFLRPAKILARW